MKRTRILSILAVLSVGTAIAVLTLRADPNGAAPAENAVLKGPHGGRLLIENGFQIEITIYEQGVPPQFRVYPFEDGRPIDPNQVTLAVELHRLGGRIDRIRFQKEADYLRGDQVVEEPHSFDVRIVAERNGRAYRWDYAQVEGRVAMPDETAAASGIEIQAAGPARMKTVIELPGEIGFNRNKLAHVVPRLPGVVTELRKNLGDRVAKGEIIAVLDSRELAEAKSDYIESVHRLEFAQAAFVREESLWKKKISPEQDYLASRHALEEAELARQTTEQKLIALGLSQADLALLGTEPEGKVIEREVRTPFVPKALTRYEIRSPLDGIVVEKQISVGEAIKEDADIFMIADLSTVWAEITVYAKDLRFVRPGQNVTVRSKELGLEATGKISYLGTLVGEQTRAAAAHVDLPNPNGLWRPGLFVTVELVQQEFPVPVAVTAEAIQTFRDWNVVFVRYGDQFEVRPLELGRNDGKWVEVVSGLAPGETYAARNSFVLKADLGKSGASHDH